MTKLIVENGAVRGVASLDIRDGVVRAILGRAVILAPVAVHDDVDGVLIGAHVDHEPGDAQGLRAQMLQRGNVEAFEHRVDGDPVAVRQRVIEAHRLAVDDDQVDLAVRHAERLDWILDGGLAVEAVFERTPAVLRREKIVQFLVKAKAGELWFQVSRYTRCHCRPGQFSNAFGGITAQHAG